MDEATRDLIHILTRTLEAEHSIRCEAQGQTDKCPESCIVQWAIDKGNAALSQTATHG